LAEDDRILEGVLGGGEAEADEGDVAAGLDPIAAALLVDRTEVGRPLDPRLASYLVKQEELAELQAEQLRELVAQRELQLAHLRVRRWKDRFSLSLQGLAVATGAVILAAFIVLGWQAHEDHGLVVTSFTAPPGFAARGIAGDTVASDVMDRLSAIASFVRETSWSSTGDVTTDRASDVKIEIPETGISLNEAWRLLREWLGSARKVSGSLRDEGDGRVVLTARLDGGQTFTAAGAASDLGALEQNIAEQVYGATDPNNLAEYLSAQGRKADAFAAAARYGALARTREDRANAIVMVGDVSNDPELEARSARVALTMDPGLRAAHGNVADGERQLEHPQEALVHARAMLTLSPADQPPQHRGVGATQMLSHAHTMIAELTGDFSAAVRARANELAPASPATLILNAVDLAHLHDIAASSRLIDQAQFLGSTKSGALRARYWADAAREDWLAARGEANALATATQQALDASKDPDRSAGLKVLLERRDRPMLAVAQAHAGHLAEASALIATTPLDCYACVVARGQVASEGGDRAAAERWFTEAIRQAPDVPGAYVDRGRLRLAGGNVSGSLADAEAANRLGPRFSDALKLWGDALARQGRRAQALARYDAALAEAPAWLALRKARAMAERYGK
jgi:tetratricopeptide (TPR) repeat protein